MSPLEPKREENLMEKLKAMHDNVAEEDVVEPIELSIDESNELEEVEEKPTIRTFAKNKHDDKWNRTPNITGHGAIHCKTFHAKLREDAIEYMDQLINEWLDAHPEYEVKFVTSTSGELHGKNNEAAIFITVWV